MVLLGLVVAAGVVGVRILLTGGSSRSASATRGVSAPHAPLAATTTTSTTPPLDEPGGGRTLLPGRRIVAFYGAAGIPALGVLGEAPPDQLWPRLAGQAASYSTGGTATLPAYELVAWVAQAAPGKSGSYAAKIPDATIASYLAVVRAHQGLLILDIQPGRSDFLADAQALAPWLTQPDVALALDPEWVLAPGQTPLRQIGSTTAAAVNQVSTYLQGLVAANHLPQKLLVVHQFTPQMVQDKPAVTVEPDLATVFNMDGFGAAANKATRYQQLAADARFGLGYKVFYHRDTPPLTPTQVLDLAPAPQLIEYE